MNHIVERTEHSPPLATVPTHLTTSGGRRIRLLSPIGRGGATTVYKSRYEDRGDIVATKLFDAASQTRTSSSELEYALALRSPRLVRAYGAGFYLERRFLVMEYLAGGSLNRLLERQTTLPLSSFYLLGRELCRAVADLHAYGLIHRDLKPHNVLFTAHGQLKLADFGLACEPSRTHGVTPAGTSAYLAPEQALGGRLGMYTDVYALGVILFRMVTGRLPFEHRTPIAMALAHTRQEPPTPSALRPDLPRNLDPVILRCLAKEPLARYASPTELLRELAAPPAHAAPAGVMALRTGAQIACVCGAAACADGGRH